jgi:hypothetical protein
MTKPNEEGIVGVTVLMDSDVHQALVAVASRNERSLTKEIRWRLRQSIKHDLKRQREAPQS